jgi:hypothetical protein
VRGAREMGDLHSDPGNGKKPMWSLLLKLLEAAVIGVVTTVAVNYTTTQTLKQHIENIESNMLMLRGDLNKEVESRQRDMEKLRNDLYEPKTGHR